MIEIEDEPVILNTEEIRFPYSEPYKLQTRMMNMISEAIQIKKNLIIESPTGTGKTLCLLSATLAAAQTKKIKRVYYLTRTHSQMDGIVKQIRTTLYRPEWTPLQSAKPLCVHAPVKQKGKNMNIQQFTALCGTARMTNQEKRNQLVPGLAYCSRTTKWGDQQPTVQFPPFEEIQKLTDFVRHAQEKHYCPLFYTKALSQKAQLIVMSYNYLLNPFIFLAKDFQLQNSVIIFDEAHNILNQAKQQNSVKLQGNTIIAANTEVNEVKSSLTTEGEQLIMCANTLQNYVTHVKQFVTKLQQHYNQTKQSIISLQKAKEITNANFQGFQRFRSDNKANIDTLLLKLFLLKDNNNVLNQNQNKKRSKLGTVINNCFMLDLIFSTPLQDNIYLCVLERKFTKQNIPYFVVQFYCKTAKTIFKKFQKAIMIFASGTLNKSQVKKDTGLQFMNSFQIQYSNNQDDDQNPYNNNNVQTILIKHENGQQLKITKNKPNQKEVLNILQQVIPDIPNGILVFFKSSGYQSIVRNMIRSDHFVFSSKAIYFEEDDKMQFKESFKLYKKEAIKQSGAVFFSYIKGKLSQGVNFKDQLARAVFIVGLPLISDDSIQYKVNAHLDKTNLWNWWSKDAMQSVNQAVGRVLRHTNDFGQVFLLGKKLCQDYKKLPKWLLNNKCHDNSSIGFIKLLIQKFFRGRINPVHQIVQEQENVEEEEDIVQDL